MNKKIISCFLIVIFSFVITSCSNSKPDLSSLKMKYNSESLLYFSEVGFCKGKKVEKWDHDIKVSINGIVKNEDVISLKEFVEEFNSVVENIRMTISDKEADIVVQIKDSKALNGYTGIAKVKCYPFSNIYRHVNVYISHTRSASQRKELIYHEMLHAIGLNHSKKAFKDINLMAIKIFKNIDEAEKWKDNIHFPALDKMAIKILYDEIIPVGLDKIDFTI